MQAERAQILCDYCELTRDEQRRYLQDHTLPVRVCETILRSATESDMLYDVPNATYGLDFRVRNVKVKPSMYFQHEDIYEVCYEIVVA